MSDRIIFKMPSDAEMREAAKGRWAASGKFNIDQWPEEIRSLSIPTKLIPITDIEEFEAVFDGDENVLDRYAALIDHAIGWDSHFIRLNSRSPKDAAYPSLPITCSGKQAMMWIATSMRCLEDASLHRLAGEALYICARDYDHRIRPELEFRCFAKGGRFIAASRYDYLNPNKFNEDHAEKIWGAAERFYRDHLAAHYHDVVFDLNAPGTSAQVLIELNPYGLSDPCCFGSYVEVEKGGVRFERPLTRDGAAHE